MQDVNNFSAGKIALASPDRIRLWPRGEVKKTGSRCGRAVEHDSKGAATRVSWATVSNSPRGGTLTGPSLGPPAGIPSSYPPVNRDPSEVSGGVLQREWPRGASVIGVGRDHSRSYVADALLHALPGSGAPRRVPSGGVNSRMVGLVEGSGRHRRIASHTSWQGGGQPRNV